MFESQGRQSFWFFIQDLNAVKTQKTKNHWDFFRSIMGMSQGTVGSKIGLFEKLL